MTQKIREEFEKWVTAKEPAYAAQNLERLNGGRGNYRIHNVAMWWMAWQAALASHAPSEAKNSIGRNGAAFDMSQQVQPDPSDVIGEAAAPPTPIARYCHHCDNWREGSHPHGEIEHNDH